MRGKQETSDKAAKHENQCSQYGNRNGVSP